MASEALDIPVLKRNQYRKQRSTPYRLYLPSSWDIILHMWQQRKKKEKRRRKKAKN